MTLTQINKAGLDELALDHVFTIGASGSSAYTFQGEGLNGTVNNPTLYLTRGKTYRFENGSGGHPIRIQSTSGASGTAYNTGVTNNAGSGTVIVEVQHDAPDVLYYQCTSHAAMNGILYITGALADGGVTTAKLADSAVTTAKIADDAVTDAKLANSINSAIAANTAKTTNATHTGDVTGSGALTIANNAVTTAKIADDAVTTSKINANAVTTVKINDNAVTTAKIQAGNVTTAKLANDAVDYGKLADGAVLTAKIVDNAVTTAKIANDAVTNAKIADDAIEAAQLDNNSVTAAAIAADAVGSSEIAAGAVTTAKIADDAVTSAKIGANQVTTTEITVAGVQTVNIADNAVDMNKLADLDNGRIIARVSSGSGSPEAATAAQIRTLLNVEDGAQAGSGGLIKLATRRYYGFDQTTGIGNAGFTRMDKAFVTITPSSASNYIRLGGVMNWSGSDTENQYSFRWRREISGGATTSLDASVGSGLRPGIQFRLLGNGDVATLQLQGVIDYPNTTSAVTYYIEAFVDGANQSVYLNRGQNDSNDPRYERAASYFTAEEIDNSIHTHTNTNS